MRVGFRGAGAPCAEEAQQFGRARTQKYSNKNRDVKPRGGGGGMRPRWGAGAQPAYVLHTRQQAPAPPARSLENRPWSAISFEWGLHPLLALAPVWRRRSAQQGPDCRTAPCRACIDDLAHSARAVGASAALIHVSRPKVRGRGGLSSCHRRAQLQLGHVVSPCVARQAQGQLPLAALPSPAHGARSGHSALACRRVDWHGPPRAQLGRHRRQP